MNINTQPLTNRVQDVLTNLYRQLPTFSMTQIMMFAHDCYLDIINHIFYTITIVVEKIGMYRFKKKYIVIFPLSRRFPQNIMNIHSEIIILKTAYNCCAPGNMKK